MIILTGGAGFIGSNLLKRLNEKGYNDILVVDNLGSSKKWKNLLGKNFSSYCSKEDFLEKLPSLKEVAGVFHLGACSSTTESDVDYLMKNNVEYSKMLFEYCSQKETPFIYASSASVYGLGEYGYSDSHKENKKFLPLNPYGFSKHLFDSWALTQKKAPPAWFGLRFFNVYGPGEEHKDFMQSVVSKAIKEIKEEGSLKLFKSHKEGIEDGEQKRDFVYVKDLVNVMIALFEESKEKNLQEFSGIYNLGSGKAKSFYDLASEVFKGLEKEIKINWIPMPEHIRSQYQYFTKAPMEKLRSLNFLDTPFHSLEDGIQDYMKNLPN